MPLKKGYKYLPGGQIVNVKTGAVVSKATGTKGGRRKKAASKRRVYTGRSAIDAAIMRDIRAGRLPASMAPKKRRRARKASSRKASYSGKMRIVVVPTVKQGRNLAYMRKRLPKTVGGRRVKKGWKSQRGFRGDGKRKSKFSRNLVRGDAFKVIRKYKSGRRPALVGYY